MKKPKRNIGYLKEIRHLINCSMSGEVENRTSSLFYFGELYYGGILKYG